MTDAILYSVLITCITLMHRVIHTDGHGRLVEPPSRSSMWRYRFGTPINYNDNQLSCGGYAVQWEQNGGRCGVCGDPYSGSRDNEAGGSYATGTIVRHYNEGHTINVTIDVTTNHGGYFEFRICPNNNHSVPVTEACLNMHILQQPNGDTKWYLPVGTKPFSIKLVLPSGITCSQCVMQWKWNTASNWDCDISNNCCKGCGPQEQFYGCADVSIAVSGSNGQSSSGSSNTAQSGYGSSHIGAVLSGTAHSGYIPIDTSRVIAGTNNKCEATSSWKIRYAYADQWCMTQCAAGNCPVQYCQDACRS